MLMLLSENPKITLGRKKLVKKKEIQKSPKTVVSEMSGQGEEVDGSES